MERFAASISRNLYLIPGGYFFVLFIRRLFKKDYDQPEWRTFSFRGIVLKVDISKQMGNAIYWRGAHDWSPIFALEKLIKPGYTIMDIGANQGEYTIWAARKTESRGRVYAYEPLSHMFNQLQENLSLNPALKIFTTAIQVGLSDRRDKLKLYTSDEYNEGINTIYPTSPQSKFLEEIEVETLDNEAKRLKIKNVDLIKIDVEGAELFVLRGAKTVLEKFRPIIFLEINKTACLSAGYSASDIFQFLKQYNYNFYKIGLRGKISSVNQNSLPEFCNIIAKSNSI